MMIHVFSFTPRNVSIYIISQVSIVISIYLIVAYSLENHPAMKKVCFGSLYVVILFFAQKYLLRSYQAIHTRLHFYRTKLFISI